MTSPAALSARLSPLMRSADGRATVVLLLLGVLLWWACRFHPSLMPGWAPWDFSILWYLAFGFTGWWYVRGLATAPQAPWRIGMFAVGMIAIWAVLQTHYEYLAQHMFFFNRIQHVVMHHLGPFLIAIAWPWPAIRQGMPAPVRAFFDHRWFDRLMGWARQPEIACFLFVGLIALWLYPPVHFVAMVDPPLYTVMNWSMVLDGLLFWCVVLDPRGAEEAGNSFAVRAVMCIGIMFPQIAIGAIIAFADHDIYSFYAWCGRIYANIDAVADQRIGGLIVWIPPAMMSALSLILVLNAMRMDEERRAPAKTGSSKGVSSASWTGR